MPVRKGAHDECRKALTEFWDSEGHLIEAELAYRSDDMDAAKSEAREAWRLLREGIITTHGSIPTESRGTEQSLEAYMQALRRGRRKEDDVDYAGVRFENATMLIVGKLLRVARICRGDPRAKRAEE